MLTQDQMIAQLRLLIPALGTVATALGVSSTSSSSYVNLALTAIGPIAYVATVAWSLVANNKASITKSMAGMKETEVKQSADGTKVTITTTDPTLVAAAKSVPQTTPPKE
jgi:hypothetical protein